MKRFGLALMLCGTMGAQSSYYSSNVTTSAKNVPAGAQAPVYTVPFSKIVVCSYPATPVGSTCTNTASVYSDQALTMPLTQPFSADAQGQFGFWANNGTYAYSVQSASGAYLGTYTVTIGGAAVPTNSSGTDQLETFSPTSARFINSAVAAANHFTFNDGTDGWYAGTPYHSYGDFIDNTGPAMMQDPGYFSAAQVLNEINKYIGAVDGTGRIPIAVKLDGTASIFCSTFDQWCHYATGDGWIILPQLAYLYYQKTGSYAAYTAILLKWKAAVALVPRNSTTKLFTIVPGQEYVCGEAYEEYNRGTGDVSQCNVWYAWDTSVMAYLANIAGDSTNKTYFQSEHANTLTGITAANLLDSSSGLLKVATGQNSTNLDVYATSLAVVCDYDPNIPCGVLSSAQKTAVSAYFVSNYSSLVNTYGFVMNSPTNYVYSGYISTSGGGGPGYSGHVPGTNQDGFWPRHLGWFLYALNLTSPSTAATLTTTYLSSNDPSAEYFDFNNPNTPTGGTQNLVSPSGVNWFTTNYPVYSAFSNNNLCTVNAFGTCKPNVSGAAVTIPGSASLTSNAAFSILQPSLGANQKVTMAIGQASAAHQAGYIVWNNTATPFMDIETNSFGDPVRVSGSQVWLGASGGTYFNNANATGGATIPSTTCGVQAVSIGAADQTCFTSAGLAKLSLGASIGPGGLLFSNGAPTIASGFGSGASVAAQNGTAAFTIHVGSAASSGVITMPAAATGWNCSAQHISVSSSALLDVANGTSTTSVTISVYNSSGASGTWAANDYITVQCQGR